MTDSTPQQAAFTVTAQTIQVTVSGQPDLENRFGPGCIRPDGVRLSYRGHHIDARVDGQWVRESGEVTDSRFDQCYAMRDATDIVQWPDWLCALATLLRPAVVSAPVSPAPADRAELRSDLEDALKGAGVYDSKERMWHSLSPEWIEEILTEVLAVLPAPADRPAILREAAGRLLDENKRCTVVGHCQPCLTRTADATLLRRMAGETLASTAPLAAGLPLIQGNCPACKRASLFLGNGGYTTCSNPDCTEPDAATTVLEQYGAEAHPPQHTWRVETRDPLPDEWAPGSHFASRPHAVERYETANSRAPLWKDGTPVERRIVRETTTYTVEEPKQPETQAFICKCPAEVCGCGHHAAVSQPEEA